MHPQVIPAALQGRGAWPRPTPPAADLHASIEPRAPHLCATCGACASGWRSGHAVKSCTWAAAARAPVAQVSPGAPRARGAWPRGARRPPATGAATFANVCSCNLRLFLLLCKRLPLQPATVFVVVQTFAPATGDCFCCCANVVVGETFAQQQKQLQVAGANVCTQR